MTTQIPREIQNALDEIARCQKACKDYYFENIGDNMKDAACFSRIAAAYEYSHAVFAKAVGAESDWAEDETD